MDKKTAVDRVDAKLRKRGSCLADVCKVDRTTPFHWNRPANRKNGRGGSIPDKYHPTILETSRKIRAGVTPCDLINA